MSTDAKVTKKLMKTLKDGEEGFAKGAEKLSKDGVADLSAVFKKFSDERSLYYAELDRLAAQYGDDLDEESGSVAGAVHRGWMSVKETFSSSDAKAILDAAEQGEDHAKAVFEDALNDDISAGTLAVVKRQYDGICAAHDEVKRLRDSIAA